MNHSFVNSPAGQLITGLGMGVVAAPVVIAATEAVEAAEFVPDEDLYSCECRKQREQRLRTKRVILVLEDR